MCLSKADYFVDTEIVNLEGTGWKLFTINKNGKLNNKYRTSKFPLKLNKKYKAEEINVLDYRNRVYVSGFHIHCDKGEALARLNEDEDLSFKQINHNTYFVTVLGKVRFSKVSVIGEDLGSCVVSKYMEILELYQIFPNWKTRKITDIKEFCNVKSTKKKK